MHACAGRGETPVTGRERRPWRTVFMGAPAFAALILRRLLDSPLLEVCGVCTRPDRPAGRGRKPTPTPVKTLALQRALPLIQPPHFRNDPEGDAAFSALAAWEPDLLIVAAYGLILPRRVLDLPLVMPLNAHASLLPRHRGAAPIQRALLAGDRVTGISIMRMVGELDAGPLLLQRALAIGADDTYGSLHDELAGMGAELLVEAAQRLKEGRADLVAQDEARATYASKITGEDCRLDFSLPAASLHARARALHPRPGAVTTLRRAGREDLRVTVAPGLYPLPPELEEYARAASGEGGAILGRKKGALLVSCRDGAYAFTCLRPAGGRDMGADAFFNGYLSGASDFSVCKFL
ncbi:MAG: methionyl-tRNA formyltransferase [Desulfovibrio sp.]|nr:methionyl-tRNA formyltransferase [Desulfovibrio sp.]